MPCSNMPTRTYAAKVNADVARSNYAQLHKYDVGPMMRKRMRRYGDVEVPGSPDDWMPGDQKPMPDDDWIPDMPMPMPCDPDMPDTMPLPDIMPIPGDEGWRR